MCHEVTKELLHLLIYRLPPHSWETSIKNLVHCFGFWHTMRLRNCMDAELLSTALRGFKSASLFSNYSTFFSHSYTHTHTQAKWRENGRVILFPRITASLDGTEYITISNCIKPQQETKKQQTRIGPSAWMIRLSLSTVSALNMNISESLFRNVIVSQIRSHWLCALQYTHTHTHTHTHSGWMHTVSRNVFIL